MILRNSNRERFTVIDNRLLEDDRLTWEALGVLAYLLSKPDGWVIRPGHLQKARNAKRDKLQRIFKELRRLGYLVYQKGGYGQTGTVITLVESPGYREPENPVLEPIENRETRQSGNPAVGKHGILVNTDKTVNTDKSGNIEKPAEKIVRLSQGMTPPKGLNVEAWTRLETYRSQVLKKPYKTDLKMRELATYPPEIQAQAIEQTITQEWSGCFPEKLMPKAGAKGSEAGALWERIVKDIEAGTYRRESYTDQEIKILGKIGGKDEIARTNYARLPWLRGRFIEAFTEVQLQH
jgi:hypothetical protein